MKQYLNKLCEEEAEKIAKKHQEQAVLRDELNSCNAEMLRRREVAKEQEKLIEQKVMQFQEEKAVSRRVLNTIFAVLGAIFATRFFALYSFISTCTVLKLM